MLKYNYGKALNKIMYGQEETPLYNLANITFNKMYLFFGSYDTLADLKDAYDLKSVLTCPYEFKVL